LPLHTMTEEPFAFRITREFLDDDHENCSEYISDRIALLVGSLLAVSVVLLGLIIRGSS
jgi:hypothetical protein